MQLRACQSLVGAVMLTILSLPGCRDQAQPASSAAAPAHPSFALPLAAGGSPAEAMAPAVDALPPASHPLIVVLDEGPERYRPIDQALAASDAFAGTPPDYVVRYRGAAVSIWRAENGGIRAVERLAAGDRAYFYRALTEQPYLVADPGTAFGYDRGALAAAYDGNGLALPSMEASRRVVAAARLLDRGTALHGLIMQGKRQPAHAGDWRAASAGIDAQRERWRQSLGREADWHDWHERDIADREERWSAERRERLAYAAALRAAPATARPHEEAKPVVVLAAAPAAAGEPSPPATRAEPTAAVAAASPSAKPPHPAAHAAARARISARRPSEHPHHKAAAAKTKRKPPMNKRLRHQPRRHAVTQLRKAKAPVTAPPHETTRRPHRTPKLLRDVGNFFGRTFGVRVHRSEAQRDE